MSWRDILQSGKRAARDTAGFVDKIFSPVETIANTRPVQKFLARDNAFTHGLDTLNESPNSPVGKQGYFNKQVIEPVRSGVKSIVQKPSLKNVFSGAMDVGRGAYNATPLGIAQNAAISSVASVGDAVRTGHANLMQAFNENRQLSQGFDVKNPVAAGALDITTNLVSANPRGVLSGAANLKNLTREAGLVKNVKTIGTSVGHVLGTANPTTSIQEDLATVKKGVGNVFGGAKQYVKNVADQDKIAKVLPKINAPVNDISVRSSSGKFSEPHDAGHIERVYTEKGFDKALRSKEGISGHIEEDAHLSRDPKVGVTLDSKGKVLSVKPDRPEFGEYLDNARKLSPAPIPEGIASKYEKYRIKPADLSQNYSMEGAQFRTRPQTGPVETPTPGQPHMIKRLDENAGRPGYGSQGNRLNEPLVDNNPALNVNRLNVTPEAKQVLSETIDANNNLVTSSKGPPIKRTEVIERATQLAKDSNGAISRDEILNYQARMLSTRQALAQEVEKSGGVMTPELAQVLKEDLSQSKFLASSLSNRAINADGATKSPLVSFVNEISKHGTDIEEVLRRAEGIDFNDGRKAAEFYREFLQPKTSEWLDTLRYNSMLSSPNTQINNAFSGAIQVGLVKPTEKTIAGGIDFLHSAFTGKEREIFVGEGGKYLGSALKNIGEGAKTFGAVMRGEQLGSNLDTRMIPLATKGAAAGAYKALSFPMKVMEGMDQFFQTLAKAGEESSLAYRVAKGGKVPGNIEDIAASNAERTLFRRELGQKGDGTLSNAIDYLPMKIQEAKNSDNPMISNIARWTLPFVKTPTNILKQGVEYSPAGILNLPGNANKTEALAKTAIGSAVFAGAATLLGAGRLTWGVPTSDKEKQAFYAAGMQPYSVKVGDKWISYSKLGPLAFPIAMVAAIDDAEKNAKLDQSTTEQVIAGIAKYGEFFADQSYLKSIGDLLNSGQTGGLAKTLSNYPQQLIPYRATMGWLARLTDTLQRDPSSVQGNFLDKQIAQMMSQIPGLAEKLPARTDDQGNALTAQNPVLNAFTPLRVTSENPTAKSTYDDLVKRNDQNSLARQQVSLMKEGRGTTTGSSNLLPVSGQDQNTTSYADIKKLANGKYGFVDSAGDSKTYSTTKAASLAFAKDLVGSGNSEREVIGDHIIAADPEAESGYKVYSKKKLAEDRAKENYTLETKRAETSKDYQRWETLQRGYYNSLHAKQQTLDAELDAAEIMRLDGQKEAILTKVKKYRLNGNSFTKPKKAKKPKRGTAKFIKFK